MNSNEQAINALRRVTLEYFTRRAEIFGNQPSAINQSKLFDAIEALKLANRICIDPTVSPAGSTLAVAGGIVPSRPTSKDCAVEVGSVVFNAEGEPVGLTTHELRERTQRDAGFAADDTRGH